MIMFNFQTNVIPSRLPITTWTTKLASFQRKTLDSTLLSLTRELSSTPTESKLLIYQPKMLTYLINFKFCPIKIKPWPLLSKSLPPSWTPPELNVPLWVLPFPLFKLKLEILKMLSRPFNSKMLNWVTPSTNSLLSWMRAEVELVNSRTPWPVPTPESLISKTKSLSWPTKTQPWPLLSLTLLLSWTTPELNVLPSKPLCLLPKPKLPISNLSVPLWTNRSNL